MVDTCRRWEDSAHNYGEVIILQDTHENSDIRARQIQYKPDNKHSLNDYRFYAWLDCLTCNMSIDNLFITDISDVEFYKNPFELIHDKDTLFIGSNDTWRDKPKYHEKMHGILTDEQFSQVLDKPLINPGIIGGSDAIVYRFLCDMCDELDDFGSDKNMNMIIANKVVYFYGYKYQTGFPLHTQFKKYEGRETGAYIRHK